MALLIKGADVNQADAQYRSYPLLMAAWKGHASWVEALLNKGADVNQANAQYGSSLCSWRHRTGMQAAWGPC